MQQGFLKRTWAEIDYGAAAHNFGVIRRAVPDTAKIMCVVKADAYGHGAAAISAVFDREGADWFGVSNLAEAVFLRETGIVKPILIFGYTPAECAGTLYEHGISQAVFSPEYAVSLSDAAKTLGVTVKIHIKIDTGMSRIGFFFQHPAVIGCYHAVFNHKQQRFIVVARLEKMLAFPCCEPRRLLKR